MKFDFSEAVPTVAPRAPRPAESPWRSADELGRRGAGDRTVEVTLSAAAYDVPAGHSLTLVVDTVDPLYSEANVPGDSITVAGASYLDLQIR